MKINITVELKDDTSESEAEGLAEAILQGVRDYDPELDGIDLRNRVRTANFGIEDE